jgi:hypothetical protein
MIVRFIHPAITVRMPNVQRLLLITLVLVGCTSSSPKSANGDSAFVAVQSRGAAVMGVDQYTSAHVFEELPDGGRIVLERKDASDSAGVATIRAHMRTIAAAFARGDFTDPGMVHMTKVPGTEVMAAKRDSIRYTVLDHPAGAELRLATSDTAAIRAIHEFLAFQRMDHRASGHMAMPAPPVVRIDGVGPLRVGMTAVDARKALGLPASAGAGKGCSYLAGASTTPLHANVMLAGDTVVRFDVRDSSIATAEGARVGDGESRVESLYDGRVSVQPHKYVAGGHYLVVTDPAHPGDRLVFETDGNVVTQFRAGRTPEVMNIEGCG